MLHKETTYMLSVTKQTIRQFHILRINHVYATCNLPCVIKKDQTVISSKLFSKNTHVCGCTRSGAVQFLPYLSPHSTSPQLISHLIIAVQFQTVQCGLVTVGLGLFKNFRLVWASMNEFYFPSLFGVNLEQPGRFFKRINYLLGWFREKGK